MIIYSNPVIETEQTEYFKIGSAELESAIQEMQVSLTEKFRKNEQRETCSIDYASRFITTVQ